MQTADFTIADVLAWARTKPADEAYKYVDGKDCAIAQFLKSTGRATAPRVSCVGWREGENETLHTYPIEISGAANSGPDTFGNFVANLEALAVSA